jgi:toxin ParE1/3/4
MAELIWTAPALAQLDGIADYIASDNPTAANALVKKVFDTTDHVERFIRLGRSVPEISHPNYRQIWIAPCWIYYRIENDRVFILHVRRHERPLNIDDVLNASP